MIWMMETSVKIASRWVESRNWGLLNRSSFTVLIVMVCCRSPWPEVWAGSRTSSRKSVCCIGRIHSYHPSWWTWPLCQTASTSTSTPLYWAEVPWAPLLLPTDWWCTYWRIPHRNAWVTIRSLEGLYSCMDVWRFWVTVWVMSHGIFSPDAISMISLICHFELTVFNSKRDFGMF